MRGRKTKERRIHIRLATQRLDLLDGERTLHSYPVSTARNGGGEQMGSECTPRGAHEVCAKIGADHAPGAVFEGREPTGQCCTPERYAAFPDRDWILTRILWLAGRESGRNQGGDVDTRDRYIYIHGTPDATQLGVPGSHGCVRMRNRDVSELFDLIDVGTPVEIE